LREPGCQCRQASRSLNWPSSVMYTLPMTVSSAGVPYRRTVPLRPCWSYTALTARAAPTAAVPRAQGPQPGPAHRPATRWAAAGRLAGDRLADAGDLLRQLGQGVVLGEDADDRFAGAVLGDEGGRHAADALGDAEAGLLEDADEPGHGAVLLQAQLGVGPDVLVDRDQLGPDGVEVAEQRLLERGRRGGLVGRRAVQGGTRSDDGGQRE